MTLREKAKQKVINLAIFLGEILKNITKEPNTVDKPAMLEISKGNTTFITISPLLLVYMRNYLIVVLTLIHFIIFAVGKTDTNFCPFFIFRSNIYF